MLMVSRAKQTFRCFIPWLGAFAAASMLLAGCGPRDSQSVEDTALAAKGVVSLLQLTPPQAVTAASAPSLRELEGRVESFLIRASPQQINMEAEIRVVVQQLGRAVHVPDARSLEDIALEIGLDPERPVAVYVAAAQPPDELTGAFAAYVMDMERVEGALRELSGGTPPTRTGEDVSGLPIYASAEGEFAYFIRDDLLVCGLAEPLVRSIAERLSAPLKVPYEPSSADHIVQLTQPDALRGLVDAPSPPAEAQADADAGTVWTQTALDALAGGPPVITTWRIEENSLDVITRIDAATHPNAMAWRGAPGALTHLRYLPEETVAVISVGLNGGWRDSVEQYAESALSESGLSSPAAEGTAEDPAQTMKLLGSTATLCLAENGGNLPIFAFLVEFQNGEDARRRLRELALFPIVSETYNGIEIRMVPVPVPGGEGIYAAFQGSTLIVATGKAQLKTLLDRLRDGRASSWAEKQSPPVDTSSPQLSFVAIKPQGLTGALNAVQAQGAVSGETASTAGMFWEKLEDIRMAERIDDATYQHRLSVRVR
ncbi:MAG: hypothetical protein IT365_19020 [Candidatus Hydrogenedentes bacterium]|nr:hypothetical protein [Candidatus Hydrogenedentota bacterium]